MRVTVTTEIQTRLMTPHRSRTTWESPEGSRSTPWVVGDLALSMARQAVSEMRERYPEHTFVMVTRTREVSE